MKSKIHMLLLSILAMGSSIALAADPVVTVKTETVRYDDIRLISAVGAAVLYGRLQNAAERACIFWLKRSIIGLYLGTATIAPRPPTVVIR